MNQFLKRKNEREDMMKKCICESFERMSSISGVWCCYDESMMQFMVNKKVRIDTRMMRESMDPVGEEIGKK